MDIGIQGGEHAEDVIELRSSRDIPRHDPEFVRS
jgi:hypothetical protein